MSEPIYKHKFEKIDTRSAEQKEHDELVKKLAQLGHDLKHTKKRIAEIRKKLP